MDHADDVEGQKLGERVGQDIDRTGENTECDLCYEQDERSIKIEHRNLLAFIFHIIKLRSSRASACLIWWPVLRLDAACPFEEISQIVEFLFAQVELRHLTTALDSGRLRLHPAFIVSRAPSGSSSPPTLPDIAQLGREIGALTQQRMAIDAGVFLPDVFAARDCISERRFIRGCGFHVVMAVRRQSHEDREKNMEPP